MLIMITLNVDLAIDYSEPISIEVCSKLVAHKNSRLIQ